MWYPANQLIYRYLDTSGHDTGLKNANGDYSSTPTDFYIQADVPLAINRMLISIEDEKGMSPEEYGDLGSPLAKGIFVRVTDAEDNVLCDLTDADPIKSNAHWGRHCYDVDVKNWGNTPTDELLVARWTFAHSGNPVWLSPGEKLKVVMRDDLTGLVNHYFQVQGYRVSKWDPRALAMP